MRWLYTMMLANLTETTCLPFQMAFKEASSILSERWANLPDSAKEKYRAQAVQYNKDFHPVAKEPVKRKKTA